MLDDTRTLLLAAVGLVDLTEERLEVLTKRLVERGTLAVDQARAVAAQCARAGRHADRDARVRAIVEDALGAHNVASHADVADLKARVAALEATAARESEVVAEA